MKATWENALKLAKEALALAHQLREACQQAQDEAYERGKGALANPDYGVAEPLTVEEEAYFKRLQDSPTFAWDKVQERAKDVRP